MRQAASIRGAAVAMPSVGPGVDARPACGAPRLPAGRRHRHRRSLRRKARFDPGVSPVSSFCGQSARSSPTTSQSGSYFGVRCRRQPCASAPQRPPLTQMRAVPAQMHRHLGRGQRAKRVLKPDAAERQHRQRPRDSGTSGAKTMAARSCRRQIIDHQPRITALPPPAAQAKRERIAALPRPAR